MMRRTTIAKRTKLKPMMKSGVQPVTPCMAQTMNEKTPAPTPAPRQPNPMGPIWKAIPPTPGPGSTQLWWEVFDYRKTPSRNFPLYIASLNPNKSEVVHALWLAKEITSQDANSPNVSILTVRSGNQIYFFLGPQRNGAHMTMIRRGHKRKLNPLGPIFQHLHKPSKRSYVVRKVWMNVNGVPIISDDLPDFDIPEEDAATFGQIVNRIKHHYGINRRDVWWDWQTEPYFGKGNFFYPENSDRPFAFGRWEPPL